MTSAWFFGEKPMSADCIPDESPPVCGEMIPRRSRKYAGGCISYTTSTSPPPFTSRIAAVTFSDDVDIEPRPTLPPSVDDELPEFALREAAEEAEEYRRRRLASSVAQLAEVTEAKNSSLPYRT